MSNQILDILLVEDNRGEIELLKEAFTDFFLTNKMQVVTDGQEAIDYLEKKGKYKNSRQPDVILLDLNLPKVGGREVLNKIKADPKLNNIPVIVLTTSDGESDIFNNFSSKRNCYMVKPMDFDQFDELMKKIEVFCLQVVSKRKEG